MHIKILQKSQTPLPRIIQKGDWIDLYVAEDTEVHRRVITYVPLGIAVQLPKGFEAVVIPRSSTAKKHKVLQANSIGLIDNSYCGNDDEWKFPAYAIGNHVVLHKGDRICQFRIQLSQKATVWQKLKWLFSSKIKIKQVSTLTNPNRKGLGSTGL